MISINRLAFHLVEILLEDHEYYKVEVEKLPCGATIIDTGIKAQGGYEAGLMITKIAMGGAGSVNLGSFNYGGLNLPSVVVSTDHPAISLFGSQLAGWKIKAPNYTADSSGPGRALSLKPKKIFEKIGYRDQSEVAVLLLETDMKPNDEAAMFIAESCGVSPENTYLILTTTVSVAGMVQISGRIVETGLFRLDLLGLDPKKVLHGFGYAPIMPLHKDMGKAMGRAEDALTYGGVTNYIIDEDDDALEELVQKAPSSSSKEYGRPSYELYKEVNFDFTQIDPAIFAPSAITVTSAKTGKVFSRGEVNTDILKKSINF
ncbi:methenyltetrahydromethanopterin cyclohydrolase [Candidatus Bathyarchaeota archaeon]|nr:methenyltetrahydromethanopterin cyclohydrolase [Candidatus Bathyarchaeota archaeon]MBS7630959.1 methenyltetrahydromethanopterin cyclohydrolase [Candidatus Bathyarchaeota archaeon]